MPGRKKITAAHKKQLNRITARLIDISLKVDGYIYKQKPISVANAQMYIEEVCSYRIQCKENARSLQVIDKLIYQMKTIIEEQEEIGHSDNIYEMIQNSCTRECVRSPVYSLADSNVTDEVVEVSDLDTKMFEKTSKELETIDLCDDDDNNIITIINQNVTEDSNVQAVNEMQKSLSTLSLKQTEVPVHINPDAEIENCSQSILGVSLPLSELTKNNIITNTNDTGILDIDTTLVNHNNKKDSAPLFTCNNNAIETLNMNASNTFVNNVTKSVIVTSSESKIVNVPNEIIKLNKLVKNKPIRKRKPKVTTEKIVNNKKDIKPKKRKPEKPATTEIVKVPLRYDNNKVVCPLLEQTNIIEHSSLLEHTSINNLKPSSKVNISRDTTNKSINNIYSNEIVDDLSWIENVRYVREVSIDEFDPKLTYLDESFWDNYELPNNWDDRDFMY